MSIIGYARVSTDHQSLDQQRDALAAAGAQRIFTDHGYYSARERDKPWLIGRRIRGCRRRSRRHGFGL